MTNKIRTLKPMFSWLQRSVIYACKYKFLESGVFFHTYSELTQQPCCAEQGGVSSTYGLDTNHWATLNRKRVLCPMLLTTVCLPHQRKIPVSNGKNPSTAMNPSCAEWCDSGWGERQLSTTDLFHLCFLLTPFPTSETSGCSLMFKNTYCMN